MPGRISLGKILVVDDRADFRKVVRDALAPYCTSVAECADGGEVVAGYTREAPEWVLMDVRMKHVDGLTATRQLLTEYPKARVVVLTSFWGRELSEMAHRAGALGCFSKEDLMDLPAALHQIAAKITLRGST